MQSAPPATAPGTFFDPLYDYVASGAFTSSAAGAAPGEEGSAATRISAILTNPAALRTDRVECAASPADKAPTVLIDLDPAEGDLLPIDPASASPALAAKLAQLRERNIDIVWISEQPETAREAIRAGLFASRLDPAGADELLLLRSSDERKQLYRDQLANNACLVAIAGDERSDFHELFDYLLRASDAASLEPLIGEGWFLIPTPLLSERP